MDQALQHKITQYLKRARSRGASRRELAALCRIKPKRRRELEKALASLEKQGILVDTGDRVYAAGCLPGQEAVVTRLNRTFGFVRPLDVPEGAPAEEIFIPGRYFLGALPGDTVLVLPVPPRGDRPEGKIIRIIKEGASTFTATLDRDDEGWFLRPDRMIRYDFPVRSRDIGDAQPGDKVLCEVVQRGRSHADHTVRILRSYGDAQTAVHCAQAILDLNGISPDFPAEVEAESEALRHTGITETDLKHRLDLREELLFTIDSADSKDLDDAVSLTRTETGFRLGVHIADVSHYVRAHSALDREAFRRGTSIYFADRVIPMLPKALSNGICSLNPQEDRLAFSCLLQLDERGQILGYEFQKSVIRSRVKGVYKEINALLAGTADAALQAKYEGLTETIFLMKELADILTANRRERGAPDIETSESYILLDEHSHAVGIVPRTRGASEVIIEEFMLTANQAAAHFARKRGLPFVYRVHEPPAPDRLETLRTVLDALGLPTASIQTGAPASALAALLRGVKGEPSSDIVSQHVLRAMSKAKYQEQPIGHYGLALEDYAHFTSPIRRYPDLTIHRILSDAVDGMTAPNLQKRYSAFASQSARKSSETELTAMQLERECEDCYRAEFMRDHLGEEFEGIVSGFAPQGIYVRLANTVEGLIRTDSLPAGEYDLDGLIECVNRTTGQKWRIGDPVRVTCVRADVPTGNIDLEFTAE